MIIDTPREITYYIGNALAILLGVVGICLYYIIGTSIYADIVGNDGIYARCWDSIGFLMSYLFAFQFFNRTNRLVVVAVFLILYIVFHFIDLPLGEASYFQYEYWCSIVSMVMGGAIICLTRKIDTPLYRLIDSHPFAINVVPFIVAVIGLSLYSYLEQFHSHFHDIPTRQCSGNEFLYSFSGYVGALSLVIFLPIVISTVCRIIGRKISKNSIKRALSTLE